jgi:thymidylate kinase
MTSTHDYDTTVGISVEPYLGDLGAQSVPYCVLGPTDNLPARVESDLDIVIDLDAQLALRRVVRFCQSCDLRIVQYLRHEISAHYCVLWRRERDADGFVSLDICRDYLRNARLFLTARELVSGRLSVTDSDDGKQLFFVPKADLAFIYYLVKRIDKADLTEKHGRYLSRMWGEAPGAARRQLDRFFRDDGVRKIARAAESGVWSGIGRDETLRRQLRRRSRRLSIRGWYAEIARIAHRMLRPSGIHVAFLGADGSGKSSVIEGVAKALTPAFRRTARRHLFPSGAAAPSRVPVIDPHAAPLRGSLLSAIQLTTWLLRYVMGWLRDVWPTKVGSTAVLFDRYYHDLLVDPRRYRYGGPAWLARVVGRLVPKPDLWILLDAPVEVLQARKQEVSVDESDRQRLAYLALMTQLENGVVIDASRPLREVTREATRAILEVMVGRTAVRLGLDCASDDGPAAGSSP